MAAYEVLLLNTAVPQIQAAQSGDTYVVPRDIAFSAALTLSAGTANGVPYLNASKVLTTGSALTFDGTNLGVGATPSYAVDIRNAASTALRVGSNGNAFGSLLSWDNPSGTGRLWTLGAYDFVFGVNSTEQMRLTSTGLGIGTSSPQAKLDVANGNVFITQDYEVQWKAGAVTRAAIRGTSGDNLSFYTRVGGVVTETMRLDSSGNLGLGVTPSAWASAIRALDISAGALAASSATTQISHNAFFDGTFKYKANGFAAEYRVNQGNGSHAWYTAPSGTAGNAITFTQAMTLDASGNLLVGTTSASTQITFVGGSGITYQRSTDNSFPGVFDYLKSRGSVASPTAVQNGDGLFLMRVAPYHGSAYTYLNSMTVDVDGTFTSGQNPPTRIAWYTNAANGSSTERARITSGGDFLIGTTTSQDPLTVNGGATLNGGLDFSDTGTKNWQVVGNAIDFYIGDQNLTRYAQLQGITTFTAWTFVSDRRLKHQIKDLHYGLDALMQIKPREFNFIKDDQFSIGFIAQELKEVIPEAVTGNEIEFADNDSPEERASKTMGISKEMLIPVLVKAIQEQQAMINELKAEVAALKGN